MDGGLGQGQDHDFLLDDSMADFDPRNWGQALQQGDQYHSYQPQQQTHAPQNAYAQQYQAQQQVQQQVQQQAPRSQPQPQPQSLYANPYNNNNNTNPLQYQPAPAYSTPYASQQYQQHARPSNAFTAGTVSGFSSAGVDPSVHLNGASYQMTHDGSYQYMAQPNRQATISPQALHPNLNANPQLQPPNRAHSNSPFLQPGGHANNFAAVSSQPQQPASRAQTISPFLQQASGSVNPSLYTQQTPGHVSPYNPAPQQQQQQPNRVLSNPPQYQSQVAPPASSFYPGGHNGQYQTIYQNQQQAIPSPRPSVQYQVPPIANANATTTSSAGFKRSFDHSTFSSTPQVILPAYVPPPAQVEKTSQIPTSGLRVTHPELLAEKETRPNHPLEAAAQFVAVVGVSEPASQPELKTAAKKRQKKSGAAITPSGVDKPPPKKRGRPPKDKNAPTSKYKGTAKPPRAPTVKKLREDGSIKNSPSPSVHTSSSEEESSSEEDSDDEEEMPVLHIDSVRNPVRPTNLALAAEWDAIGIIWKDPYSNPSTEVVNESMVKYVNFVMDIKSQIKEVSTKISEAAGNPSEVTPLEARRAELFDALYHAIYAALKHGYQRTLTILSSSPRFVSVLVQTLRECLQTSDYGRLPKAILSLMTNFETMSDALLQKVKFEPVQKRWNKRTDEDAKKDIAKIYANTIESVAKEKSRLEEAKEKSRLEEAKKSRLSVEKGKSEALKVAPTNAAKRPHEGDGTNGKPAKKFASDVLGAPGGLPAKIITVKKPTGNLLGISTRPAPKPVVKKREPSPPQESKLGALLASIAKPAEPPKAPLAPPRAPETPEEKARRERKESRRHLRVKFKDGPELEQIRLFKHEQGEDEGRQDDMLRDANDTHNEGMMHKKRLAETIDDEDDYQPPDVEEAQFPEPRRVDFTQLDKSTRYGPIFTSRGGDLQFTTPEQKTQAHREAVELLAIYTDPSDIPPSAKEPSLNSETATDQAPPRQIAPPAEPWVVQRLQELNYYGPVESFRLFTSRQVTQEAPEIRSKRIAQAFQTTPAALATTSSLVHPKTTRDQIKTQLTGIKQASAMSDLEKFQQLQKLIDTLKGKPFPPTEPPEWMANQSQRNIWIEGHHRDNAEKLNGEAEQRILQAYQQHALAPQFNQPPVVHQYQPASQQAAHDYAAGNGNKNGAGSQAFDYNAWAAANLGGPRASESGRPPRREEPDIPRRDRDDRFQGNFNNTKGKNYQQDGGWDPNYKYKKEPCTYYAQGRCAKGDACTYVHE